MAVCPDCESELDLLQQNTEPTTCPFCGAIVTVASSDEAAPSDQESEVPTLVNDQPKKAKESSVAIPNEIPGFELVRHVGRGGMGSVWEARQNILGRRVAIKVLAAKLAQSPHFQARFTREAQTLARLQHPGIVSIYDFILRDDYCCIVMEYVDGPNRQDPQTVFRLIRDQKLDPERTEGIILEVLDALAYAHEEGVVHRDIKPSNILITRFGRVKLVDFGIASIRKDNDDHTQLTQAGGPLGTLEYMSPEQIDNPTTAGHQSDLYSVGVVLYEMLTGQRPRGVFQWPSEIDPNLSPGWDDVVRTALQPSITDRYQNAAEMMAAIQTLTAQQQQGPNPGHSERASMSTIPDIQEIGPPAIDESNQKRETDFEPIEGLWNRPTGPADDEDESDASGVNSQSVEFEENGTNVLQENVSGTNDRSAVPVSDGSVDDLPAPEDDQEESTPEPTESENELLDGPYGVVLDRHPLVHHRPRQTNDSAMEYRPFSRPATLVVCLLDDGETKEGEQFRIRKSSFVIGRSEGDIVLPYDRSMSGKHAEIRLVPAGDGRFDFEIRDLNTTNGTFARATKAILEDQQQFLLGSRRYQLHRAKPGSQELDSIVELSPKGKGKKFALRRSSVYIGRDPLKCALVVLGDPFISPVHAKLKRDSKNRWTIRNLGSKNGVWMRVDELTLTSGGVFQVGSQRVSIKIP
ncbi:FHA domain-containing serine/threonine-protein kinase [Thalassoroseus pseudoceratinae]|uniref:FHA domain-containing serine/threonine-protein kinase n=1 Tax=Thalassoroseus pseudoceratinae TaxID=2713176 RepID=UPI0014249E8D|nr:FHA domain-containing serine/threonine-protein kinase [Thalassoroseus pseudoceratinae]